MANAQQPAQPVDELEPDPSDTFGVELAASIRANKALLTALKYEYGQQMARAQAGTDEFPSAFDLNQLKRLEREIQNDEMFARARLLTRMRSRAARGIE